MFDELLALDELLVFVALDEFLFFIFIHHPFRIRMCRIFVFMQKNKKFIFALMEIRETQSTFYHFYHMI